MTYIFKNLNKESTFEDFRVEHNKYFNYDFYESMEEVPTGKISECNNEFVYYDPHICEVVMWIDDGSNDMEELI